MMFDSLLLLNNPVFAYTAKCVKTHMKNFLLKVFFNSHNKNNAGGWLPAGH